MKKESELKERRPDSNSRTDRKVQVRTSSGYQGPLTLRKAAEGLTIERLGLVVSIFLLIGIGALAARELRALETLAAALVLIALSWGIFILGLGLTIPVWPEW